MIAAFRGWKDTRNDPRKAICFGDDSPISVGDTTKVIEPADELSFDLAWHTDDVAIIDTYLVMHGQCPF